MHLQYPWLLDTCQVMRGQRSPSDNDQGLYLCTGASAGYFLRNRALQGSTRQLFNLALIVGFNFILGSSPGTMIDNSGHLGGLVVGLLLSLGMAPRWDVVSTDLPMLMSINCTCQWPEVPIASDPVRVLMSLAPTQSWEQASLLDTPCVMVHRLSLFKETHVAGDGLKPREAQSLCLGHWCDRICVGCAAAGGRHPSQFNASA